jgi:hypothetical protein
VLFPQAIDGYRAQEVKHRDKLSQARERIKALEMELSVLPELREELYHLRARLEQPAADAALARANLSQPMPQLPWTIIHQYDLPGGRGKSNLAQHWDAEGSMQPVKVISVRVEPTGDGRERIMLNDQRVRGGDLYINGHLRHRSGAR